MTLTVPTRSGGRWVPVWVPDVPETVAQMADRLAVGEAVLCRPGARGRLTGLLKARSVFTRQATQPDGNILFAPCGERAWK